MVAYHEDSTVDQTLYTVKTLSPTPHSQEAHLFSVLKQEGRDNLRGKHETDVQQGIFSLSECTIFLDFFMFKTKML